MISESEYKIMEVLWRIAPCTAKQVIDQLADNTDWKDKTIKTLLNRLLSKGVIDYQKTGREYLYTPLIEKHAYQQQASKHFLSQLFGGKLSSFVSHFAQSEKLTDKEIAQLKQIIKGLENDG